MQPLFWYLRRLRSMSPREVAWRARQRARHVGRRAFPRRSFQVPSIEEVLGGAGLDSACSPAALGGHLHGADGEFTVEEKVQWLRPLVARADRIVAQRIDLFDLTELDLGPRIRWNYEYKAGLATPMGRASTIDYRDYSVTGDCKFVWELNRHQHLVVLGRAYHATGDERYAAEVVEQIESWIEQCPYGYGMNWRSPLELGIRLINWTWALELIRKSKALTTEGWRRLLPVVYAHLGEITREYSRFSSANNHLIGEAAGVFIACSYFRGLGHSDAWRAAAREALVREIVRQTHSDGGTREQALGYQLFVMEFLVLAGLTARNCRDNFPSAYWDRLEKMFEFTHSLTDGGHGPANIGDSDDGYVLELGDRGRRVASMLGVGALIFHRAEWVADSAPASEAAFWLLGIRGSQAPRAAERFEAGEPLRSRAFPDSGYYLLQCGRRRSDDRVSVIFDCGPLGFLTTAAHGHADALAVILRLAGQNVLIDCGTYDYFTHPTWRNYFRSTRAHNTAAIDGLDSSEMLGPFLWGRRANCRCVTWEPSTEGGRVYGEHDGYTRLSDPVIHRRAVSLDGAGGRLEIEDELMCKGEHTVALHWHVAPGCQVIRISERRVEIAVGDGAIALEIDGKLRMDVACGEEDPIQGWASEGYHRKAACNTIVGSACTSGTTSFLTKILFSGWAAREGRRLGDAEGRHLHPASIGEAAASAGRSAGAGNSS